MSIILSHSNEVGGTTILDDNTKIHWNEGGSETVVIYPDGRTERISPFTDHPILALPELKNNKGEHRQMTKLEEDEWSVAMYGVVDLRARAGGWGA